MTAIMFHCLQGVSDGWIAHAIPASLDDAMKRKNWHLIAPLQAMIIDSTLSAIEAVAKIKLPGLIRFTAIVLFPVLTNILCIETSVKTHPRLYPAVLGINKKISVICRYALVASFIAQLVLGLPFRGVIALACFAMQYFKTHSLISQRFGKFIDNSHFAITFGHRIIVECVRFIEGSKLTALAMIYMIQGVVRDRLWAESEAIPSWPEADPKNLHTLFKSLKWSKALDIIEECSDADFEEWMKNPILKEKQLENSVNLDKADSKSDEDCEAVNSDEEYDEELLNHALVYFEKGLLVFLEELHTKSELEQALVRQITYQLMNCKSNKVKARNLFRLALAPKASLGDTAIKVVHGLLCSKINEKNLHKKHKKIKRFLKILTTNEIIQETGGEKLKEKFPQQAHLITPQFLQQLKLNQPRLNPFSIFFLSRNKDLLSYDQFLILMVYARKLTLQKKRRSFVEQLILSMCFKLLGFDLLSKFMIPLLGTKLAPREWKNEIDPNILGDLIFNQIFLHS